MSQVMPPEHFANWLADFLPQASLEPVEAVDSSDGKLCHFDGLNLSRAWMLASVARALPDGDPRKTEIWDCATRHGRRGVESLTEAHYASAHWLGTFVLRWLTWELPPRAEPKGRR